jgi:GDP-L-fucose synthase
MVGSALVNALEQGGYKRVITSTSSNVDLTDQTAVKSFFADEAPEIVVLAAAKVGGIEANDRWRADFLYENLMIEANVIKAAHVAGTQKLIFLGSSCIYPRLAIQPLVEEALLTGLLEPTNEAYAVAKIAGLKLCESFHRQYGSNFFSLMPTNLYGPKDNFNLDTSHVIPALVRKFHDAKVQRESEVSVWGTGTARREFLFMSDLAEAIVFALENIDATDIYSEGISHLNVGCGQDIEIRELAELISSVVGFDGAIRYDASRPDGTPRKLLDVTRLTRLGWRYKTTLRAGLDQTYKWYEESITHNACGVRV